MDQLASQKKKQERKAGEEGDANRYIVLVGGFIAMREMDKWWEGVGGGGNTRAIRECPR